MTYKLYNRDGSGGFVVEAALALADLPFGLLQLDTLPGTPLPESFRAVNPWCQVPVLILPDGTVLTETVAILLHLAACNPNKGLAPAVGTSAHAQLMRWLVFAGVNVYESHLRSAYPQRFTTAAAGEAAVREAAIKRTGDALRVLDNAMEPGPYLLGGSMTVADIYIAMLHLWYPGEQSFVNLMAMTDEVRRHPVIAPIWIRHFGAR
jgi:glutathione S-transferase